MVTATVKVMRRTFEDVEVINPNGWFGNCWLVEMGGCAFPSYVIIEAETMDAAMDEFSDSKYGHQVHIAPEDLKDYVNPDDATDDCAYYDGSGRPCDFDNINFYKLNDSDITYHGTPKELFG